MRNGPVVTAGGLLFIASGPDRMVHALDKDTGKTLWETEIDAMPDGIPAVYEVGGREYIAFYAAVGDEKETLSYNPASRERKATTCLPCRSRRAASSARGNGGFT